MEWKPIFTTSSFAKSYTFFSRLRSEFHAKVVTVIMEKLGKFLGHPVGVIVPHDVLEFEGNLEALRALRLLDKFRSEGFVGSFYPNTHSYGDEPHGYVTMATLTAIKRFGFNGKGADMFDRTRTLWPAVGESVERYAMQFNYPSKKAYCDASWNELTGKKADIFNIAGFDDALREKGHHDYRLSYDKDTQFRWVQATSLPDKKPVWAPLQWFSFTHVQKHVHKQQDPQQHQEPLLAIPITTGVATGQNETDAILRGLLEVIERDGFIIYWLNQMAAKRIDLDSCNDPEISLLADIAKRYRLEVHTLYLETDIPAHTVGCIVIDRSGIGPALLVGAKTSLNLREAIYSVLSDTLSQRGLYRRMMDSEEYKKQNFDDLSKIGHVERIYYWFPKERLVHVEKFISGEIVPIDALPKYSYEGDTDKDLASLLKFFSAKNYEVFYRELLSDKLRTLTEGLSVTMVRVPKLQPVYLEESLHSLGGERLYTVPKMFGYEPRSGPGDFFAIPHPFP